MNQPSRLRARLPELKGKFSTFADMKLLRRGRNEAGGGSIQRRKAHDVSKEIISRPMWRRTALPSAFALVSTLLAFIATGAAFAGTAVEIDDAGTLPASAQSPSFGPITSVDTGSISGTLLNVNDVDMYRLCLTGNKTFSASMVGTDGTLHDPQLWLFDSDGRGVYANDDAFPGTRRARLPANHALTPSAGGTYYLAISSFVNNPFSATGAMFPFNPPAINGPAGNQPITGWTNGGRSSGTYTIELTGVDQRDTDNDGIADGCEPDAQLQEIADELNAILAANPGTPLADKVEDALAKVESALTRLEQTPPDRQGALGELEGAVGDLEAAVKDGLLGAVDGNDLMDRIAGFTRLLAEQAIAEAEARGGDLNKITEAEQALADGDTMRAAGQFKDAVANYKDAVAKAEGA